VNILVADDDPLYRKVLEASVRSWNYEVRLVADGVAAWEVIEHAPPGLIAILDWSMPGLDGLELCQRIRLLPPGRLIYVMLLTARSAREDIICGLRAGADDYITKPCDHEALYARIQVASRMLRLQQSLADRVRELEAALARVNALHGLLPMCCYCKSIRNDQNYWEKVEHYIAAHSELEFSHGICPSCYAKMVEPQLERARHLRSSESGVRSQEERSAPRTPRRGGPAPAG
jgi:CheY-like chemotaxis protein